MQQFSSETEKWILIVERNISEFTSSEASNYFRVDTFKEAIGDSGGGINARRPYSEQNSLISDT